MQPSYHLALHIFRRDLRLQDNSALLAALSNSVSVIPCFIFDKRQIGDNAYKSQACIQFMANSLNELNEELLQKNSHLYCFYGIAEDVVEKLTSQLPIDAIFINRDYTPFSNARDQRIESLCQQKKIAFHYYADALLHEPEEVFKPDGKPYTIFTPFFKKASQLTVAPFRKNLHENYYREPIEGEDTTRLLHFLKQTNPQLRVMGGRKEGLKLLKKALELTDYIHTRDIPSLNGTSHLSAHNKFGTVSIREIYHSICKYLGKTHTLITELYWRDFFTHIVYHFPRVFGNAYQEKFADLPWENNLLFFDAWCQGKTGFPIVDAGMRELNTTGYMHNRVRMIAASFLVKDLHIDWRWGEKYFAQQLVDYDPAVNNGNWQWAASTGCDAQPYFRIFNPWSQQQKFDLECAYIKRWIPELAHVPIKHIHKIPELGSIANYPKPIVDHSVESQKAKMMYREYYYNLK